MRELEIKDKNGLPLKEGDHVIAGRGWVYSRTKPKSFPEEIKCIFEIKWNKFQGKFELQEKRVMTEYLVFDSNGEYRLLTELEVSWDNRAQNYREDMRNMRLEKIEDTV